MTCSIGIYLSPRHRSVTELGAKVAAKMPQQSPCFCLPMFLGHDFLSQYGYSNSGSHT